MSPMELGVPWGMGYQYNDQKSPPKTECLNNIYWDCIYPFVFPLKSSSHLIKYTFLGCISALLFSFPFLNQRFVFIFIRQKVIFICKYVLHQALQRTSIIIDTPQYKLLFLLTFFILCVMFFSSNRITTKKTSRWVAAHPGQRYSLFHGNVPFNLHTSIHFLSKTEEGRWCKMQF